MKKTFRTTVLSLVMVCLLGVVSVYAATITNTKIYGNAIGVDQDGIEWKAVSNPGYTKVTSDIILENAVTKSTSNAISYVYYGMEYKYDSGLVWNEYYQAWIGCVNIVANFRDPNVPTYFFTSNVDNDYTVYSDPYQKNIPKGHNAYIISGVENNKLNFTLIDSGTKASPLWKKIWQVSIPVNSTPTNAKIAQIASIAFTSDNYSGVYNKNVTFDRVNVYKGTAQTPWTNSIIYGIAKGTAPNTTVTYTNPNSNYSKVTVNLNCQ